MTVLQKQCHQLLGFGVVGKDDGGDANHWPHKNSHVWPSKDSSHFSDSHGSEDSESVKLMWAEP